MPVAAAIGAAGSIGGALLTSGAASKASAQQVAEQQEALQLQQQNFGNALQFQQNAFGTAQNALNPFITSGTNLLPTVNSLLTPGPSQTSTLSQLPGFRFQSQYGTMATTNALAARGLGGSTGPLARGISDYNQGLAGTYFNNYLSQLLAGVNIGTSAAGSLASAAGTAGSNVGNLTANTNNTLGTTLTNTGNAAAAGTLGSANALAGGLTGATTSATNALLLSRLLPDADNSGGIYGTTINPPPTTSVGAVS